MEREYNYKLRLNVSIDKTEKVGDGVNSYWNSTQERLTVEETLDLGSMDFLGVMKVLGQLHDAMHQLKNGVTG